MKVIYEPKGRAREYSALALNLYNGCSHGCKYCYVPACQFKNREEFYKTQTVRDIMAKVEADCKELQAAGNTERVLLCFTCDPYQKLNDTAQLTRQALELFRQYRIPFQVLTKGGSRAEADFDLYSEQDAFATTLTLSNEKDSKYYEPEAANPDDRIRTIIKAHIRGIKTWVSFEPVLEPNIVLEFVDITADSVDLYKVGKISNYPTPIPVDWKKFAKDVVKKLKKYDKDFYIKKDLAVYLD